MYTQACESLEIKANNTRHSPPTAANFENSATKSFSSIPLLALVTSTVFALLNANLLTLCREIVLTSVA